MIQAFPQFGLLYAARPLPGVAPGARPPRAAQSAAAEGLLRELRGAAPAGRSSKAHARGWVAAAVAPEGPVGIDIEYCEPGRDIGAIAAWLMGAPAPNDASAYRVFTFREAYFKAVGEWPAATLLRAVSTGGDAIALGDLSARFELPAPDFVLALVWSGQGDVRRFAA